MAAASTVVAKPLKSAPTMTTGSSISHFRVPQRGARFAEGERLAGAPVRVMAARMPHGDGHADEQQPREGCRR